MSAAKNMEKTQKRPWEKSDVTRRVAKISLKNFRIEIIGQKVLDSRVLRRGRGEGREIDTNKEIHSGM